jgi:hypothetical protein
MSPQEVVDWLEQRRPAVAEPREYEPLLSYPVTRLADISRAAATLGKREQNQAEKAELLKAHIWVLSEALDVMVRFGVGPTYGLTRSIRQLEGRYGQTEQIQCLYVDLYRGLSSVAAKASKTYVDVVGLENGDGFTERIKEEAASQELNRLQDLYGQAQGRKAADLAAIYIVKHLWGKDRDRARGLLETHKEAWKGTLDFRQRAAKTLGDILAIESDLVGLSFTGTSGKRWHVSDLRGQDTVFCFVSKGYESLPVKWHKQYGERLRVVAVPVLGADIQGRGFVVADPDPKNISALRQALHVYGLPTSVLVTQDLKVIKEPGAITRHLESREP